MDIHLHEAGHAELPVLANLMSLYLHDFSEIFGDTPRNDGTFDDPGLSRFISEAHRVAFLIKVEGALAGFALASRGSVIDASQEVWDMSEFFVVRGLRRQGVGQAAASAVFQRLGGAWEVRVLDRNQGASKFWPVTISEHTEGKFESAPWKSKEGAWTVFRFRHDEQSAA
jgi:predicted acetyltransferase